MKRFLLPILSLLLVAFAVPPVSAQKSEEDFYVKVETMPTFNGGDLLTFRNWVFQNIVYPKKAQKNGIQGRVLVQFVIDTQGTITEINVLQTPDNSLSDEVVRILKSSPKWTPGIQDGKAVRVKYTLPVDFRIEGNDAKLNIGDEKNFKDASGVIIGFFDADHKHGMMISIKSTQADWNAAQEWCKSLGEGWRLPEADELKYINTLTQAGKKITFKQLEKLYKSSCWAIGSPDADSATFVDMPNNSVGRAPKSKKMTVYAVAAF
jgi:TonB family protein